MYLKNLDKTVKFRISNDDYESLLKIALENNISISYLIRFIIKYYLGGDSIGNFKTN